MMGYDYTEEVDQPTEADINDLTAQLNTEHQMMVAALMKPGTDILDQLTPQSCNLIHAAMGVSGEAGELLDAIKKAAIYRKPINRENVVEELGDLEFYMEALRSELRITREETLKANITKLAVRYAEFKYSDQAAIDRADKSE